jgi:rubrerythrin
MGIFEFAMQKEKYSENYYRELAGKTGNKGLQNILNMLADEEAKHYKVVQQMKTNMPNKITNTPVLKNAKKVFQNLRESMEKFNFDISELQLYEKAKDIEQEAKQFYLEKADEADNPDQKEIFKRLANEEQKHFIILENICDFVAKPQSFLENAEFHHIDDYVEGVF